MSSWFYCSHPGSEILPCDDIQGNTSFLVDWLFFVGKGSYLSTAWMFGLQTGSFAATCQTKTGCRRFGVFWSFGFQVNRIWAPTRYVGAGGGLKSANRYDKELHFDRCVLSQTLPKAFGFSSSCFFSSQDWFQLYMLWNMLQSSGILGEIDWFVFRGVNWGSNSVWQRWMGQSSLVFTVTFLVSDVLLLFSFWQFIRFRFHLQCYEKEVAVAATMAMAGDEESSSRLST